MLTVQALVLTPDVGKLLVVHTARQIAGQDRYGVGLISTQSKELLPWRTRLWDDNLQFVGGIQRIYAGAISPDGEYFVVTSGSGGDRPPINDTAVAYPIEGGDNMEPLWISRLFDSVYSVAISDVAVYVGGHFNYMESPSAPDPWPGLTNVGYGRGQGLAGYGLGDDVVVRSHIGALDPATGKALEWNPESNSFEGNKAMLVMPAVWSPAATGRCRAAPTSAGSPSTTSGARHPRPERDARSSRRSRDASRRPTSSSWSRAPPPPPAVSGTSGSRSSTAAPAATCRTTSPRGAASTSSTSPGGAGATATDWSQALTISGNRRLQAPRPHRRRQRLAGSDQDDQEDRDVRPRRPDPVDQHHGSSGVVPSTTFAMTGTAERRLRRQRDQHHGPGRQEPLPPGRRRSETPTTPSEPCPTWSGRPQPPGRGRSTVPYEATGPGRRSPSTPPVSQTCAAPPAEWIVSSTAVPPTVRRHLAAIVNPPTAAPISSHPGHRSPSPGRPPTTKSSNVEILLRNTSTRENLAADGTWGVDAIDGLVPHLAGQHLRVQLQLVVHHPVRPGARHLHVHGAGHRRARTGDGRLQPWQPHHQRASPRRRVPRTA